MSGNSDNNSLQVPNQTKPQQEKKPLNTDMPPPMLEVPKLEMDTNKREKSMGEFLAMMDNYAPIVNTHIHYMYTFIKLNLFYSDS
jgi:hypothetical protein